MSPELLTAAEEAYIAAEDRRNRQRATFKNGRRQLRCSTCGCWRAKCGDEGYPSCRRCGDERAPKAVTIYPRPENSPTWERFLAAFLAEDREPRRAFVVLDNRSVPAGHDGEPMPF